MDDKRELNDILIGGEDVKTKNTKKLILLIIAIVVLIIAIAAIMLNLSSNDTESIAADTSNDTSNVATEANLPPSDGFGATSGATPADDDSIQFEQIVQEIKSRQQNAQGQNVGQPSTPPPATITPSDTPKIQMPERVATPPQTTSPRVVDSRPEASSMSKSNNGDIAENGIYLQVGAFSKTPNKQFLDSINKYSYRVQEIIINSKVITRYLIGPYASRNAAQKDVNAISRDITKPVLLEIR